MYSVGLFRTLAVEAGRVPFSMAKQELERPRSRRSVLASPSVELYLPPGATADIWRSLDAWLTSTLVPNEEMASQCPRLL